MHINEASYESDSWHKASVAVDVDKASERNQIMHDGAYQKDNNSFGNDSSEEEQKKPQIEVEAMSVNSEQKFDQKNVS